VSGLLERAASAFVAPAPPVASPPPRAAARALVLGSERDAVPVAAALAGGLLERERAAAAALLVTWPECEAPRAALGTPAATRLAARMGLRGLDAVARGRLAWLATDELGLVLRALAAADGPAVVAITGPRSAASDELLAEQDHVVLVVDAEAEPQLAALATADLEARGISVTTRGPLAAPGARVAALAGWGRLRLEGT
jgi:hypothetical protein